MSDRYRYADENACERAGLDPTAVERVARRIAKAAEDAQRLGLCVFGGSGDGSLRLSSDHGKNGEVATLGSAHFDGGDGGD